MKKVLLVATNPGSIRAWMPVCMTLQNEESIQLEIFLSPYFLDEWISLGLKFKQIDLPSIPQLNQAFLDCDLVLCGTSVKGTPYWEFEHLARQCAQKRKIPCVTLVDHWSNSAHRFSYQNEWDSLYGLIVLPHSDVLVHYPYNRAEYLVLGNPHWEWLQSQIPQQRHLSSDLLFISEPLDQDSCSQSLDYDQYKVYEQVLNYASSQGYKVQVKLHPRECAKTWLERFNQVVFYEENPCLSQTQFSLYVGMTSMLLIELFLTGHRALSLQLVESNSIEMMPFGLPVQNTLANMETFDPTHTFKIPKIIPQLCQEIVNL